MHQAVCVYVKRNESNLFKLLLCLLIQNDLNGSMSAMASSGNNAKGP